MDPLPSPHEDGLPLSERISRLKAWKDAKKREQKAVAKDLKNSTRKLQRLKKTIGKLSDRDLSLALAERAAAKAKAEAAAPARG